MEVEICKHLYQLLAEYSKSPPPYNSDCGLAAEDYEKLIKIASFEPNEDLDAAIETAAFSGFISRGEGIGYPSGPLFLHIGEAFAKWIKNGTCTARYMKLYDQLDEGSYPAQRAETFDSLTEKVRGCESLWPLWNDDEKKYFLGELIEKIGKRGLLDMLGIRKTAGTHEIFPPPREVLMKAFETKHTDRSLLTVGARALAKHHHRDSAAFWGDSVGTESDKNRSALNVVENILNNATWINIHELPVFLGVGVLLRDAMTENMLSVTRGQLPIIEMRIDEGYGARWSPDGESFRGFLEPMMKDGWQNKYRH